MRIMNRRNSCNKVTAGLDDQRSVPGGDMHSSLFTASRSSLGPFQLPLQHVPGIYWPERETYQ
jgi:hypothetical protein